jgi:phage/plasmid-like protein (TIGR03299 family)
MDPKDSSLHPFSRRLRGISKSSEAITAAGLDWEVVKEPLQLNARGPTPGLGKTHALVRIDPKLVRNRITLGRVAEAYTPLQNREAFAFFDPLVQAGVAEYDSAGALGHGTTVWVLAKLLCPSRIKRVDVVEKYLLLVNNHSGSTPQVQIRLTPFRVFCGNMLAVLLKRGQEVSTERVGDVHAQLRQAAERLRVIEQDFSAIESEFLRMADTPMTSQRVAEYVKEVLPEPARNTPREEPRLLLNLREQAARLFETGKGNDQPGIRHTLWAAYNGVTELMDHHIADESSEARLQRLWFGNGYQIKVKAYEVALRWLRMATRADNWRFVDNPSEPARVVGRTARLEAMQRSGSLHRQDAGPRSALLSSGTVGHNVGKPKTYHYENGSLHYVGCNAVDGGLVCSCTNER